MQINLFAWIVKIVSLMIAVGGDIIMVVKNKTFLVWRITDIFAEQVSGKWPCIYIFFMLLCPHQSEKCWEQSQSVLSKEEWGAGEEGVGVEGVWEGFIYQQTSKY